MNQYICIKKINLIVEKEVLQGIEVTCMLSTVYWIWVRQCCESDSLNRMGNYASWNSTKLPWHQSNSVFHTLDSIWIALENSASDRWRMPLRNQIYKNKIFTFLSIFFPNLKYNELLFFWKLILLTCASFATVFKFISKLLMS